MSKQLQQPLLNRGRELLLFAPRRSNTMTALSMALLLLVIAGTLFSVLRRPPPWTLDIGTRGDGRFSSGFFSPEVSDDTPFRWSSSSSQLILHGADVGPIELAVRIHGDVTKLAREADLHLARREQDLLDFDVRPSWHTYHILLPQNPTAAIEAEPAPIRLTTNTYRPGKSDYRKLGIAVDRVRVVPVLARFTSISVPLRRSIWLTWVLAVLGGIFWFLDCALFRRWPRFASLRIIGGLTLSALILILWAWRDPYTLAWALPEAPWLLSCTTLALLCRFVVPSLWAKLQSVVSCRAQSLPNSRFVGFALLIVAQTLLTMQWAVSGGIALALLGSVSLFVGERSQWASTRYQPARTVRLPSSRAISAALLLLIFLLALGIRLYHIERLPYGMWRDEARHGLVALRILEDNTYRPAYISENNVDLPALGLYPFVLGITLWGIHPWSMRPITALAGALTVLPLYGFVSCVSRRKDLAFLAAALLGVSAWHISISRLSFPTIFDPLLSLTGLWLVLLGLQWVTVYDRRTTLSAQVMMLGALFVAGVCVGLALQTYHTGRIAPLLALLLAFLLLLQRPRAWRRWLISMLVLAMGLLAAAAPLVLFAIQHPDVFNRRVDAVFVLSEAALKGRSPLAVLDDSFGRHLLMFNLRGDNNGRHFAPNHPMLDFLTGLGFLAGCASLLRSWRAWPNFFLLASIVLTLMPSMLAVESPHAMRSIGAVAFACTIAAFGWLELWRILVTDRFHTYSADSARRLRQVHPAFIAAVSLLVVAGALNCWTYFVTMPNDPRVWGAFYTTHTQIGVYLRDRAQQQRSKQISPVYVSAVIAANPVFEYLTEGLSVHTFREPLVEPSVEAGSLFVLSGYTYEKDVQLLARYLGPDPEPVLFGPLLPNGTTPSFVVYRSQ